MDVMGITLSWRVLAIWSTQLHLPGDPARAAGIDFLSDSDMSCNWAERLKDDHTGIIRIPCFKVVETNGNQGFIYAAIVVIPADFNHGSAEAKQAAEASRRS